MDAISKGKPRCRQRISPTFEHHGATHPLQAAGAGVESAMYEGQSHAQYGFDTNAPETKKAFTDIANFFDRQPAHWAPRDMHSQSKPTASRQIPYGQAARRAIP